MPVVDWEHKSAVVVAESRECAHMVWVSTLRLWVENIGLGWRTASGVRGWGARDRAVSVGTALVRSGGP